MSSIPLKRCCHCKSLLPATNQYFKNSRTYKDGLHPECKTCVKLRRKSADRLKIPILYDGDLKRCTACQEWLPATLEYFTKHLDGLSPHCKVCRSVDHKLDRLNNGKQKRSSQARRNATERTRLWVKNNPERARKNRRIQVLRYRSNIAQTPDSFTSNDWTACLDWFHNCCAYCGHQRDFWYTIEADHIIPLHNPNCPGTIPLNIVPACRNCNASKSDKDLEQWLIGHFGKRKAKDVLSKIKKYLETLPDGKTNR